MTRAQRDELIAHAQAEAPKECCGFVRIRDNAVHDVTRAKNERDSAYGYEIDATSMLHAFKAEEEGFEIGSYHSHPRSSSEPSQTDINLANYPHWTYLIVSLADEPHVRAWRIADGKVDEEPIEVVE